MWPFNYLSHTHRNMSLPCIGLFDSTAWFKESGGTRLSLALTRKDQPRILMKNPPSRLLTSAAKTTFNVFHYRKCIITKAVSDGADQTPRICTDGADQTPRTRTDGADQTPHARTDGADQTPRTCRDGADQTPHTCTNDHDTQLVPFSSNGDDPSTPSNIEEPSYKAHHDRSRSATKPRNGHGPPSGSG